MNSKPDKKIIKYFSKREVVLVLTLGADGYIHSAVKGFVNITPDGFLYVVDLYKNRTYKNVKERRVVSVVAVDEKSFSGYLLQGVGRVVAKTKVEVDKVRTAEKNIVRRIAKRIINNLREGKKSNYFEAGLPDVKYFIEVAIKNVVDLASFQENGEEK